AVLRGPLQALAAGVPALSGAPANGYGPGVGAQAPGQHWGGGYTLANVAGYAYCIEPGGADPLQLPTDQWSPTPYPGSGSYSDGQMAALAYFAEQYQGSGYPGWTVNETAAAIEQVAYASAGGATPPGSQGPPQLVALVQQYMSTYAGPWSISLSMTPSSGSTFTVGADYTGTVTVTSATGNGVGGLSLTAPPTGGPSANQISTFEWLSGTTNSAGQISFQWSIGGVPSGFGGAFSAQGIGVVGDAVGTAPPAYAAPAGSGGQLMMVSGASEVLGTSFGGVATQPPTSEQGTISVQKTVPDGAYYGPAGARFEIEDGYGNVFDTLTTGNNGSTPFSTGLTATPTGSPYRVHETVAPAGYGLAPDQVVMVYPNQNTVASFSGASEEPVLAAQLGAEKIDAQTGQPLAGAVFSFAFDTADNGTFNEELGSCTTGSSGACQPPTENAAGGWLPGWYRVTEATAPPGYWLDPSTTAQTVYLQPGATAVASVTFGDELLGSLALVKTGNDTAYWPVAGATFSVQLQYP
ncbi:MAG: MSCRAMM family protein, partial [Acidimicrobiales bacterium]